MYRVIVFDFDGTLVDSAPGIVLCMQQTFKHYGVDIPGAEDIRNLIGRRLDRMIQAMNPALDDEVVQDWIRVYREYYVDRSPEWTSPYPGAIDLLSSIREAGIPMVLLSNKGHEPLKMLADRLGLLEWFDLVSGEREGVARKPEAVLFEQVLAPAFPGVAPHEMLMVGDAEYDLGFAKNTGMAGCWARFGYGDAAVCEDIGYAMAVDDLPGLQRELALS